MCLGFGSNLPAKMKGKKKKTPPVITDYHFKVTVYFSSYFIKKNPKTIIYFCVRFLDNFEIDPAGQYLSSRASIRDHIPS